MLYEGRAVFKDLNLQFKPLFTCIVGNNGCGKTTLLKLISKELKADFGNIIGNDLVYHCKQEVDEKPVGFDEFCYAFDTKSIRLKDLLWIKDDWFYGWETLSYGQKKRIQIAIALSQDVDVLLLDEPTNHLDFKSKNIVINALKQYKNTCILVSHDREVLDALCENTIIIKDENIYHYDTNYTLASLELEKHFDFLRKENEIISTKLKKLQGNIKDKKEKVALSKSRFSKKDVGKKDKSTKEKINLAKLTGKDKNDSKLLNGFSKKYENLEQKLNRLDKEYKKQINIPYDEIKKEKTFHLKKGFLKLSKEKTLYFPDLYLSRKIAIVGDNGVGKSSFLRYFISQIEFENSYFFLPQELSRDDEKNLYKQIDALENKRKGLLLTIIKRLSSNPKNMLGNKNLSEGELRKLFMAKALLENINFIILDEPTNHMDIQSIEAIEKALRDFKALLIIVSHDKVFMKNLGLDIYSIQEKGKNEFYLAKGS
ncbi:MAG: ABC transporter ATP-binding protein [Proteobacteria bacterium]|nr:MAG: ABC transporter ATP-binding protein [Pseudomonadota bacterium]